MENKRKSIYIAIFVVTTIIASCLAVFFAIKANTNTNTQVAAVDEKLSGESTKTAEDGKTEVQIKEVEKVVEKEVEKGVFVPFDSSKCKNDNNSSSRYSIERSECLNVCANVKNGNVYIYSLADNEYYKNMDLTINITKMPTTWEIESCKVKGFNKKVVDVLVSKVGNGINYPVVLFLMEDGTVEYLKEEALKTGNLVSAGPIKDLVNIVRIEQGEILGEYDGGYTPLAIDKDGYFYNVSSIIDNMN